MLRQCLSSAPSRAGLLALATILGGLVQAETTECVPITALPQVITAQGIYCLTGNLSTPISAGSAIDIQANNVTIDLNGWKIGGLVAGLGTNTLGITALNRKNITIKNGLIRGFWGAIYLNGPASQGHVIHDIQADGNTSQGFFLEGSGHSLRRNRVLATGGSTQTDEAIGIFLQSSAAGSQVSDNTVAGVEHRKACGICVKENPGTVVTGNRVSQIKAIGSAAAGSLDAVGVMVSESSDNVLVRNNSIESVASTDDKALGIDVVASANAVVRGNDIRDITAGTNAYGFLIDSLSTGGYRDNVVTDVNGATWFFWSGGSDLGNNDSF